jgi:hypothetical protein
MVGDATFCNCVAALWALVGASRAADREVQVAAAQAAWRALQDARGDDTYVMLHEQDGAVHVNGRQLQLGIDVFASALGMASLLRSRGIGEVLFDASVDPASLLAWARAWTLSEDCPTDPEQHLSREGVVGVHASRRAAEIEPTMSLRRRSARPDAVDSRLRSVFLQHHLIAAIPVTGLVPPVLAKVVVEAVVDRLLGIPGGLEPLMLLQKDDALLRSSLHVSVLTVVLARAAGWGEDRLADLGAAALLHELGAILDPNQPGPAGFTWLVERGCEDFWLRSAVVARTWRECHGRTAAEVAAGSRAAAALVRAAVELERGLRRGTGNRMDAVRMLRECAAAGELPDEFVAVADQAFLAMEA